MRISRRSVFRSTGAFLGSLASGGLAGAFSQEAAKDAFADLKNMTADLTRLTASDYQGRMEKARKLMTKNKIDVFYMNGGTTMEYFSGVRWGVSERMFALLIPARGDLAWICPKFEEGRAREQIRFGTDVRVWEEEESPYMLVRQVLQDRKIASGTVGIEPTVREFVSDGLRKACPSARVLNGEAVSQGCRMLKSKKELDYMALASEITQKAFAAAFRTVREGMTQADLSRAISLAHTRLGAQGGGAVSFGPNAAFPHGSMMARTLKPGDVILVDGGGRVEGMNSDVTRTVVFGKPSDKVRRVWDIVKRAQDAALAAARPGTPCEAVDAAARKVISDAGFGPDYKYLTHRIGHGIGMDGHEYPYLVRGNKLLLEPGMTFSDEPGIYIPGEFGLRIEDVIHIADDGAHFFRSAEPVLQSV